MPVKKDTSYLTAKKVTTRKTPVTKIGDEIDWIVTFTAHNGKMENVQKFSDIIPAELEWDGKLSNITWTNPSQPKGNVTHTSKALAQGTQVNFMISSIESGQSVSITLHTKVKAFPKGKNPKIINCVAKTEKEI